MTNVEKHKHLATWVLTAGMFLPGHSAAQSAANRDSAAAQSAANRDSADAQVPSGPNPTVMQAFVSIRAWLDSPASDSACDSTAVSPIAVILVLQRAQSNDVRLTFCPAVVSLAQADRRLLAALRFYELRARGAGAPEVDHFVRTFRGTGTDAAWVVMKGQPTGYRVIDDEWTRASESTGSIWLLKTLLDSKFAGDPIDRWMQVASSDPYIAIYGFSTLPRQDMSRLSVKFDETIRNTSGQGATRKIVTLWRHTVAHLRYVELLDLGAVARAKIGESVVAELADGFTRTEDFEWSEITRISYEYRAIGLEP